MHKSMAHFGNIQNSGKFMAHLLFVMRFGRVSLACICTKGKLNRNCTIDPSFLFIHSDLRVCVCLWPFGCSLLKCSIVAHILHAERFNYSLLFVTIYSTATVSCDFVEYNKCPNLIVQMSNSHFKIQVMLTNLNNIFIFALRFYSCIIFNSHYYSI